MVHKILKWTGIVLGSLIGVLALPFIVLCVIGTARWNRIYGNYDVPVETIPIPRDEASIARGEHIATIQMCRECHTEMLGGEVMTVPAVITITFPNLTAGGVGASNSNEDWVRAIRHDVGHDGRGLMLMPSRSFHDISDEDLGALIAYLKSLPPVDNELPMTDLGPVGRVLLVLGVLPREAYAPDVTVIDHNAPRPITPEPGITAEYGKYLSSVCTVCHEAALNGQPMEIEDAKILTPNLTPGGELRFWSELDFMTAMRTGVTPSGQQLTKYMPWKYFGQMTDEELSAVWLYLQSLPAMEQGR